MSAYTDADVQTAMSAALTSSLEGRTLSGDAVVRFILDAVAPAIAARAKAEALREFADWAEQSDFVEYPFDGLDDTVRTIRKRAAEIERPTP